MGRTLNFDLFLQEKEHQTLDVTIYGKVYHVAMEIPALVPIMMARAEESMSQDVSTKMVMRAADAMLGAENVDEICSKGMTARELASLIEKLFNIINGKDEAEDDVQTLDDESGKKQTKKRTKK